ncbi:MAG: hypothetical protein NC548_40355 [Lachnospiraceae bacterium]|nr:hypothetical protein [Lachnospiraceae bacterium]
MELTDKVLIDNLCSWPLHFKRLNGIGDVRVPANAKNFALLDVSEVQMQIQIGNNLFVGRGDSQGDHARLYIVDDEQRKALLGLDDTPNEDVTVVNAESVAALLAIRTKKDFKEHLEALVKTDAEKKMIVKLAKDAGGDDVAAWKMEAISALAETVAL